MSENENNLKKERLIKILSDIPDEAWEEIVRKEPEWKFIERIYKIGFGPSSVIIVATGLNDYQLKKGGAEEVYWPEILKKLDKEIFAEMKRLISVIWFNLSFSGVLMLTTDEVYYSQPIQPIPTKVSVIEKLDNGGTDFRPAFNLIKEKYHDNIDLFIYFTDGYGHYPENPPRYPVLWILITSPNKLKEAGYYPPYGMAIPL